MNIPWRTPTHVYRHFKHLLYQLEQLDPHTDPYNAIIEEVRCLPHFPHHYHEDRDTIVPEVVGTPYSQISIPHVRLTR